MPKVTYLFGAGASCQCLPLVSDIPDRLKDFAIFIAGNRNNRDGHQPVFEGSPRTIFEAEEEIIRACEDLTVKSSSHASIDTYAKKLFITEKVGPPKKLIILKTILSLSFVYDQLHLPPDPRYDTFFASILGENESELSGSIRIISWNYDFQFEKAYSAYSLNDSLEENQRKLRAFPSSERHDSISEKFSIYKLNGTTAFKGPPNVGIAGITSPFMNINKFDREEFAKNCLLFYAGSVYGQSYTPLLSFAWERNKINTEILDSARRSIENSEALVIVGYSFPFFNRAVDKHLLSVIGGRTKIYIQDITPDKVLRSLRSVMTFNPIPNTELFEVKSKKPDQFYLPPEL